MGGLVSAALLARAGLSVCVLESARRPGGYLMGFERGDFRFDTAIHWLNMFGPSGVLRNLFDYIGDGAPPTPSPRRIRRYKGESFDYLLTDQPDELRDTLLREFPAEEQGLLRFFAEARKIGETFVEFGKRMRSPTTRPLLGQLKAGIDGARTSFPFWKHTNRKTEDGLNRYFRSERLKQIFCSEIYLLSCLVPIGWAYTGDYQLPPPGGGVRLASWLCEVLEGFGASVLLGCPARQIRVEKGRCVAVRAAVGGEALPEAEIRCRYVIGACDLLSLYEQLLPAGTIPARLIRKQRDADLYDSAVTVSIGLDRPSRELGLQEELVLLSRDGIAREQHSSGDPHKALISLLAPSVFDPSRAPAGKGTLTIHTVANIRYGDTWKTGPGRKRGAAYREFKQQYADVLIERVEQSFGVRFRDSIEVLDVATPITHWRYTANRDGSSMGQRPTGRNLRARLAGYTTPVDNLYLASHWAEYGGGVPAAVRAAANSSALLLKRENPSAFAELIAVLDGKR